MILAHLVWLYDMQIHIQVNGVREWAVGCRSRRSSSFTIDLLRRTANLWYNLDLK